MTAARAIADAAKLHVTYPVLFMDIEIPGKAPSYTPAPDNGWNTVYASACSGVAKAHNIPASVDRADLNGFAAYLTSHSSHKAGVYSAPSIWAEIFGSSQGCETEPMMGDGGHDAPYPQHPRPRSAFPTWGGCE